MRIRSNVILRGDVWAAVIDKLKPIIDTFYGVYVISIAIGIYADKQIESPDVMMYPDARFEIGSPILNQNSLLLDLLFKSAIITTSTVDFSEEVRMELAFNDDSKIDEAKSFNQMTFLTRFANYGVTQLDQRLTDDPLENMEALNQYMIDCMNGLNLDDFDLDELDIAELEEEV